MSVATDQAELDATNAAIEKILTSGQEFTLTNAAVRRAELEALYKRKDQLQARIDRAARGGIRVRGATLV